MGTLGIETAGPVPGIGYVDEYSEELWSHRLVKGADVLLLQQLERLVANYPIQQIGLTVGPGSFTSLRVGVSIALGLAQSLNLLVVPISSLQARASLFPNQRCLSLLDARRGKVYAQLFDSTSPIPIAITSAKDAPLTDVIPQETFIAVGEGAEVYRSQIIDAGGFVPRDCTRSPAVMVAKLAQNMPHAARTAKEITVDYIRGASAVPPQKLGVPVGTPSTADL